MINKKASDTEIFIGGFQGVGETLPAYLQRRLSNIFKALRKLDPDVADLLVFDLRRGANIRLNLGYGEKVHDKGVVARIQPKNVGYREYAGTPSVLDTLITAKEGKSPPHEIFCKLICLNSVPKESAEGVAGTLAMLYRRHIMPIFHKDLRDAVRIDWDLITPDGSQPGGYSLHRSYASAVAFVALNRGLPDVPVTRLPVNRFISGAEPVMYVVSLPVHSRMARELNLRGVARVADVSTVGARLNIKEPQSIAGFPLDRWARELKANIEAEFSRPGGPRPNCLERMRMIANTL